jgi:hypothetical protein
VSATDCDFGAEAGKDEQRQTSDEQNQVTANDASNHEGDGEDVKHKEGGDRHNQDEHGGSEESESRNRLGLTCLVVREHVSHFSLLSVGCFLLLAYMLIRVSATPATVLVGCPGLLLEMEAALSVWDTAGYLGV